MSIAESKLSSDTEVINKYLDFQIEKTYSALNEAGKHLDTSFFTYSSLFAVSALLAYGKGIEDRVSIPLIQLSVNKTMAAIITLSLGVLMVYRYAFISNSCNIYRAKLLTLLESRYGDLVDVSWHLNYPSFQVTSILSLHALQLLSKPKMFFVHSLIYRYLLMAVYLGFLGLITIQICSSFELTLGYRGPIGILVCLLVGLPVSHAAFMLEPERKWSAKELIERIEKKGWRGMSYIP